MQHQHIGYHIKGFYKIASFSNKTEAMMATDAKQKLNALDMNKHGLNATQDFVGVSRSTLYRWKKCFDEGGVSALRDASKAPRQRRRRNGSTRISDEIRRLRHSYPNRVRRRFITS